MSCLTPEVIHAIAVDIVKPGFTALVFIVILYFFFKD